MSSSENVPLTHFAISGYRGFGDVPQYFIGCGKINCIVGQNNSGKSNVLRFITRHLASTAIGTAKTERLAQLDRHFGGRRAHAYGLGVDPKSLISGLVATRPEQTVGFQRIMSAGNVTIYLDLIQRALAKKAEIDRTDAAFFFYDEGDTVLVEGWAEALNVIPPQFRRDIWSQLTGSGGGDVEMWTNGTVRMLAPRLERFNCVLIPAIRSIDASQGVPGWHDGKGLIHRIAMLQNPGVHEQQLRSKFEAINELLRNVTGHSTARIEIPYERDTILVDMDSRKLPLDNLGMGIHEVITIAATCTALDNSVICIEEPETHLNPILQRKLVNYLVDQTSNQYFIATHAPAVMDVQGTNIYHICQSEQRYSTVEKVASSAQRSRVCEDLGYHPSDLVQANSVIWVEGPSDRIYLKYWLNGMRPEFVEGIHFSIMFYGGKLSAHISGDDFDEMDDVVRDFISLRALNRRGFILIDSDRKKKADPINLTKSRLVDEFEAKGGHAWVTNGREMENYLPALQIKEAIEQVHPKASIASRFGAFDSCLAIKTATGASRHASKTDVARYVVEKFPPDYSMLDLASQLERLVKFISDSNPKVGHSLALRDGK